MVTAFICSIIALLYFIIVKLIRKTSLDTLRETLFSLRDSLFDLPEETDYKIKFSSQLYIDLESMLNNSIRYAHNINPLSILIFEFLNKKAFPSVKVQSSLSIRINNQISKTKDAHLRERLEKIRFDYNRAVLVHIAFMIPGVPVLSFLAVPFLLLAQMSIKLQKSIISIFQSKVDTVEYQAGLSPCVAI